VNNNIYDRKKWVFFLIKLMKIYEDSMKVEKEIKEEDEKRIQRSSFLKKDERVKIIKINKVYGGPLLRLVYHRHLGLNLTIMIYLAN